MLIVRDDVNDPESSGQLNLGVRLARTAGSQLDGPTPITGEDQSPDGEYGNLSGDGQERRAGKHRTGNEAVRRSTLRSTPPGGAAVGA